VSSMPGEVTQILLDLRRGNPEAQDRLIPLVYRELRRIASAHLRHEAAGHSLQPTALVHEAYMRLIEIDRIDWQSRAHFFSIASSVMRRILIEHARANRADKRGGGAITLLIDEAVLASPGRPSELLALDDALNHLAQLDERQAKIVEMRFFAGMTEEETGDVLGISVRTVKRDWRVAKAWLYKELNCR
jgi:RNA polymerase sigma factor (TIGR02999 family)